MTTKFIHFITVYSQHQRHNPRSSFLNHEVTPKIRSARNHMTIYKIYIIIARYNSKGLETKSVTGEGGIGPDFSN